VVWRGKVQLKCGDGRKLLTWLLWGAPLSEGHALITARAPIAYSIGRGLAPLVGRFGDFSPPSCCSYELMKNRSARGDTVLLTPFFLQEFKYTPYFLLSSRAQCTPYFFLPSTEHYTHYFLFPSSTHIYSLFPSLFKGSIHLL
jgi:hypothetical protein